MVCFICKFNLSYKKFNFGHPHFVILVGRCLTEHLSRGTLESFFIASRMIALFAGFLNGSLKTKKKKGEKKEGKK